MYNSFVAVQQVLVETVIGSPHVIKVVALPKTAQNAKL